MLALQDNITQGLLIQITKTTLPINLLCLSIHNSTYTYNQNPLQETSRHSTTITLYVFQQFNNIDYDVFVDMSLLL